MNKKTPFRKSNRLLEILLFLILFTGLECPVQGQVTIGDLQAPQSYSALEISTEKTKGGLRLPHLTTHERDSLQNASLSGQPAGGLIIYNTDIDGVEFWNGTAWISLYNPQSVPNCFMKFNPAARESPSGGESIQVNVSSSCCTPPGNYKFKVISGDATVSPAEPAVSPTGLFTVTFNANSTTDARMAIVRVINPCNDTTQYIIGQKGKPVCNPVDSIRLQPPSAVIAQNATYTHTLTATVYGGRSPYSYQWYEDTGTGFSPYPSSGTATLSFQVPTSSLGTRAYRVKVWSSGCENADGVYSNAVSVTVK